MENFLYLIFFLVAMLIPFRIVSGIVMAVGGVIIYSFYGDDLHFRTSFFPLLHEVMGSTMIVWGLCHRSKKISAWFRWIRKRSKFPDQFAEMPKRSPARLALIKLVIFFCSLALSFEIMIFFMARDAWRNGNIEPAVLFVTIHVFIAFSLGFFVMTFHDV